MMEIEPSLSTKELVDIFGISSQRIGKIAASIVKKDDSFIRGRKRFYKASAVRKILHSRGFSYKRKIITFATLKGGTGKTTLSLATARRLNCLGSKILFIDLDKQANATISLLDRTGSKVLLDIVQEGCPISDCIEKINNNFYLLPSSLLNSRLEIEFASKKVNPKSYYTKLLKPVLKDYDYIVIDTPPDLSHSVYLAMLTSDILVIPVNLDRYSIEGLSMTLSIINEAKESYPDFSIEVKVVINKYDAREKSSLNFLTQLSKFDNIEVMPDVVRVDSTFRRSQKIGHQLGFNTRSNAASDIDVFTRSLINLRVQSFLKKTHHISPLSILKVDC